jgi:hypothetical protein
MPSTIVDSSIPIASDEIPKGSSPSEPNAEVSVQSKQLNPKVQSFLPTIIDNSKVGIG